MPHANPDITSFPATLASHVVPQSAVSGSLSKGAGMATNQKQGLRGRHGRDPGRCFTLKW
jgi:hypothetical protein